MKKELSKFKSKIFAKNTFSVYGKQVKKKIHDEKFDEQAIYNKKKKIIFYEKVHNIFKKCFKKNIYFYIKEFSHYYCFNDQNILNL